MKSELEDILEHKFSSQALLAQALTHRSAAFDGRTSYERLEFLGDRVLGFVIADLLLCAYPTEREGELAKRQADLVRRETLAQVARVAVVAFRKLRRGESVSGGRENDTILADVCEAIIAALYRDGGISIARRFIERFWIERLKSPSRPPEDIKTILQEWAQSQGLTLPVYQTIDRDGPDHAPMFTVSVCVKGWGVAIGKGMSKRAAERAAAEMFMHKFHADG